MEAITVDVHTSFSNVGKSLQSQGFDDPWDYIYTLVTFDEVGDLEPIDIEICKIYTTLVKNHGKNEVEAEIASYLTIV
jgi:hypothetical protein